MSDEREYRFLNPEELDVSGMDPVEGTIEEVLEDALLDIVQLAQAQGMTDDQVDYVLEKMTDDRAKKVRSRFRLHLGPRNPES